MLTIRKQHHSRSRRLRRFVRTHDRSWQVTDSNFGRGIGYPDSDCLGFPNFLKINAGVAPRLLPTASLTNLLITITSLLRTNISQLPAVR
jgi:hypothetical protein